MTTGHVVSCTYPECTAYFDPTAVGIGDGKDATGWVQPPPKPAHVLPHTHRKVTLPEPDDDLHGEWSPEATAAFAAFEKFLTVRSEMLEARRQLLGRLYLIPKYEEHAATLHLTKLAEKLTEQ